MQSIAAFSKVNRRATSVWKATARVVTKHKYTIPIPITSHVSELPEVDEVQAVLMLKIAQVTIV